MFKLRRSRRQIFTLAIRGDEGPTDVRVLRGQFPVPLQPCCVMYLYFGNHPSGVSRNGPSRGLGDKYHANTSISLRVSLRETDQSLASLIEMALQALQSPLPRSECASHRPNDEKKPNAVRPPGDTEGRTKVMSRIVSPRRGTRGRGTRATATPL